MTREEERIIALLMEHVGSYVDSRDLSLRALQYPRVVKQLRAQGYHIVNHVDRIAGKSVRGAYMLCTARQTAALAGKAAPKKAKDDEQGVLFNLSPAGHRDEN